MKPEMPSFPDMALDRTKIRRQGASHQLVQIQRQGLEALRGLKSTRY
jgi:hypothetical protein